MRFLSLDSNRPVYLALLVACIALIVSMGAIGLTVASNAHRIDDIQASRYEATLNGCRIRNQEHRGIRLFIARVARRPLTPQTVQLLNRYFPIDNDCAGYARQHVYSRS